MSLILEALKKAERQHKLGEVPGIRSDALDTRQAAWRGLGWLMLLLFACIMLGLGLYLGGYRLPLSEEGTGEAPPISQQASPPPPAIPPPVGDMPLTLTAPAPLDTAPAVAAAPPQPAIKPPKPRPARALSAMPSGFIAHLPTLNIDIHSYDERADKRYVLINMEKYHEGDYLTEGPLLVEIRPDGVVLEHLGERFILPIGNL